MSRQDRGVGAEPLRSWKHPADRRSLPVIIRGLPVSHYRPGVANARGPGISTSQYRTPCQTAFLLSLFCGLKMKDFREDNRCEALYIMHSHAEGARRLCSCIVRLW